MSIDHDTPTLDIAGIIAKHRKHVLWLFPIMAIYILLAVLYLMGARPIYTASATIAPVDQSRSGLTSGISSLLQGGGGLSSLLSSGGNQSFDEYVQMLTSHRLAATLVAKDNILPLLFHQIWDEDTKSWKKPSGLQAIKSATFAALFHMPTKSAPDADEVQKFLETSLSVTKSYDSKLVGVSLSYDDRATAENLLNRILSEADSIIRQDARRDVAARTLYLESEIPKVDFSDQKTSLISILSVQQQSMMMIQADTRYAFLMVDIPHAPSAPTSPKISVILMAAILLAVATWSALVFMVPERFAGLKFSPQTIRNGVRAALHLG